MSDETFAGYDWRQLALTERKMHSKTKKMIQNSALREHLDICSFSLLKEIDPDSVAYDMRLERTAIIYDALIEDFNPSYMKVSIRQTPYCKYEEDKRSL